MHSRGKKLLGLCHYVAKNVGGNNNHTLQKDLQNAFVYPCLLLKSICLVCSHLTSCMSVVGETFGVFQACETI